MLSGTLNFYTPTPPPPPPPPTQAAACIRANADNRKEFEAGGLVVNTMGWVEDLGYGALRCIVEAAQINTVIVMDNQLLQDKITDDFGSKGVVVHGFQRGGGVVERPKQYRKQQREERVAEYFKGVNTMLKPVKVCVPFSDLYLFTVGGAMAPDAPQNVPEFLQATLISPDPSLNLSVAAVSHAACREEIPHANVAGFVVILNVCPKKQKKIKENNEATKSEQSNKNSFHTRAYISSLPRRTLHTSPGRP